MSEIIHRMMFRLELETTGLPLAAAAQFSCVTCSALLKANISSNALSFQQNDFKMLASTILLIFAAYLLPRTYLVKGAFVIQTLLKEIAYPRS